MPGTDLAMLLPGGEKQQLVSVWDSASCWVAKIGLRACYAVSGTDLAYGGFAADAMSGTDIGSHVTRGARRCTLAQVATPLSPTGYQQPTRCMWRGGHQTGTDMLCMAREICHRSGEGATKGATASALAFSPSGQWLAAVYEQ
eukprot:555371-Rhodomonas_salina.2